MVEARHGLVAWLFALLAMLAGVVNADPPPKYNFLSYDGGLAQAKNCASPCSSILVAMAARGAKNQSAIALESRVRCTSSGSTGLPTAQHRGFAIL